MTDKGSIFSNCPYFASAAVARKMEKLATESWKPLGISPSHGYLLMLVLEEPGIQPGALADQLLLQPSTITRFMDKLEEKKLLVRTTEGKTTNVYPTPKAKELSSKMKICLQQFGAAVSRMLSREESASLTKTLHTLNKKINT